VLGDAALLHATAARLNLPLTLNPFNADAPRQVHQAGELFLHAIPLAAEVIAGQLDGRNAEFVLQQLRVATQMALRDDVDAIVTNPLQKSIINEAGVAFSGHTEFFAHAAGDVPVLMLLANDELRVALATTHLPLQAVSSALNENVLTQTLTLLNHSLQMQFGLPSPRIAVLGLNPHAGEDGYLGREELDLITPLLNTLRAHGLKLDGPLSADTAFTPDKRKKYDAYLAMYHDQGLPVLKALGFHRSVNITLGLPFIRTSVDHGTALDLAGHGVADASSLHYAIETALTLIAKRVK
jgi:4-hydroxythreonine-4-phosphate dehydrogenase